jgi:hypothetical protein
MTCGLFTLSCDKSSDGCFFQVLSCASKLLLSHAVSCVTGTLPDSVTRSPPAPALPPAVRFAYGRYGQPQFQLLVDGIPPLHVSLSHHSNVVAVALATIPVGVDVVDTGQQIPGEGTCKAQDKSWWRHPLFSHFFCFFYLQGTLLKCSRTFCTLLKRSGYRQRHSKGIYLFLFAHSVATQEQSQPSLQLQEFLIMWALKECAGKIDGRGIPRLLPSIPTQPLPAKSSIERDAAIQF